MNAHPADLSADGETPTITAPADTAPADPTPTDPAPLTPVLERAAWRRRLALFAPVGRMALAQMLASAWWLARFRYGPMEWLWRWMTYGRLQPMRLAPAVAPVVEPSL